jgi:hypothetical protein
VRAWLALLWYYPSAPDFYLPALLALDDFKNVRDLIDLSDVFEVVTAEQPCKPSSHFCRSVYD